MADSSLKVNKRPKDDKGDDAKGGDSVVGSNDDMALTYKPGYMQIGNNLEIKKMTVQDAKSYALRLPGCVGFTFYGDNKPTTYDNMFFKDAAKVETSNQRWNSYLTPVSMNNVPKVELESCLVLSICIEDYGGINDRDGCEIDVENIDKCFGADGYRYNIIQNSSKKVGIKAFNELIERARKELEKNSVQYDGFICIISAHGESYHDNPYRSSILLSDLTEVPITKILDNFRNSNDDEKGLGDEFLGKPKMFIVQACRSSLSQDIHQKVAKTAAEDEKGVDQDNAIKYAADQDIVLVQANTRGNVAWRSPTLGSYLIYETTQALSSGNTYNGSPLVSFDDAMYVVRNRILRNKNLQDKDKLEVVQVRSTATSKIFLKKVAGAKLTTRKRQPFDEVVIGDAYAQWVSIYIVNKSQKEIIIQNSGLPWGKWYKDNNKDEETGSPDGTTIAVNSAFTVYSCGRENSSSGTQGNFDIYKGVTRVCTMSWDCPWGKKSNSFGLSNQGVGEYPALTGGSKDSGAIGALTLTVIPTIN